MRLLQETERRGRPGANGTVASGGAVGVDDTAAGTSSTAINQVVATARRDSTSAAAAAKTSIALIGADETSTPPALWSKLQSIEGRLDDIENPPPAA